MSIMRLQWGRAVEGAETRTGKVLTVGGKCFNGAAPLKARKPKADVLSCAFGHASMGPRR